MELNTMSESSLVSIVTRGVQSIGIAMCVELQKKGYKSLLFLLLPVATLTSSVTVNTPTGEVIGSIVNYDNKNIQVFLGIPYAEPPVGNLRFLKTVPVKPWTNPVIANSLPPACHQYSPFNHPWEDNNPGQSEDCLYLNIWVPEFSNSTAKKAVMFWLYPGGWTYGSNRIPLYDGRVLAANGDVIVVTTNYRLGVLGFFTSETKDVSGNAGLYDCLEALKWVNKNIAAFGGDNKKITVFGDSSGGITAGLLCVSPLSRGLFQRIITQSGSAAYLANDYRSQNLQLGQKLAKEMECANGNKTLQKNPDDVIECLRGKDPKDLVETTFSLLPSFRQVTFYSVVGDDFLPTDPRKAIMEGNFDGVDAIMGYNQDEGSFLFVAFQVEITGPFGKLNPRINKTFGESLVRSFPFFSDPEAVIEHYLGGVQDDDYDTIRSQVYHSFGDNFFSCPSKYFAEKSSEKNNKTYRYYFNHRPRNTPWAEWMGVVHAEEMQFVFGRPLDTESNYTLAEKELSFQMVKEWTNFAKTGTPSETWRKFTRLDPYVKVFEVSPDRSSYFESHEENCEFFRPYFEV